MVAATPDPDPGDVWYVYGLQPADAAAPSGLGVGAREVTAVSAGPVRALVSQVPAADFGQDAIGARVEDLAWLSAQAAAHEDVLVRALGDGPVLPLRFGTIYRSDDAIAAFLDAHGAAVADELRDRYGPRGARLEVSGPWPAHSFVRLPPLDAPPAAGVAT